MQSIKERKGNARRIVMEEAPTYRSPTRKLLPFFRRSRDAWKRKRQEAQVLNKRLSNRVRKLEASRDRWKERAQQQQQELRRLRADLEAEKKAGAEAALAAAADERGPGPHSAASVCPADHP
jgi:molecular chaperone GrpE (heat shock protein)